MSEELLLTDEETGQAIKEAISKQGWADITVKQRYQAIKEAQLAKANKAKQPDIEEACKRQYEDDFKHFDTILSEARQEAKKQERERIAQFARHEYIEGIGYAVIPWADWQALKEEK